MDSFINELKDLGPLGSTEGLDKDTLKSDLETFNRMVPQLKLLIREKLQVKVKTEAAYNKLYTSPKTDKLLAAFIADPASTTEELPAYYVDPDKCVGCELCLKKCPIQAIDGAAKTIHIINQEQCTHCGTCYYACPPRLGAIRKMVDEPIPEPVPESERAVVLTSKKKRPTA